MPSKTIKEKKPTEKKDDSSRYFYASGRRKTAVSQVKLFEEKGAQDILEVNGRKIEEYFALSRLREAVKAPLALAGEGKKFKAVIKVSGGGLAAQADASKLAIARALVVFEENLKKSLKDSGYLTRDSRKVERKKAGLKKARRAPQWAKR